jgi:hypothetical protein
LAGITCTALRGALFSNVTQTEKGGSRDDDVFHPLPHAWPGRRPANAFAGLTRNFLEDFFLVCPSWSCGVARCSARILIHRSALTPTSGDGWTPADVVSGGKTRQQS